MSSQFTIIFVVKFCVSHMSGGCVVCVLQQARPVQCKSCCASGQVECPWCKGTGFFILGDNMLCEVPSRNTTCRVCFGRVCDFRPLMRFVLMNVLWECLIHSSSHAFVLMNVLRECLSSDHDLLILATRLSPVARIPCSVVAAENVVHL